MLGSERAPDAGREIDVEAMPRDPPGRARCADPNSTVAARVIALQRAAGNQAVGRFLSHQGLMRVPTVGPTSPSTVAGTPDPIEYDTFPDWSFRYVGGELSGPADEKKIREVLIASGRVHPSLLAGATATLVTPPHGEPYLSFRQGNLVVARARTARAGWSKERGSYHGVYLYSPRPTGGDPTQIPDPAGGGGGTAGEGQDAAEKGKAQKQLQGLPRDLVDLVGGPARLKQMDPVRLLRIAEKLSALTDEERRMFALIPKQVTDDIDKLESAVDNFIALRDRFTKEKLEEAIRAKAGEKTLEQKQAEVWKQFDAKAWDRMTRAERVKTARRLSNELAVEQVKHMATHPGETAAGIVKSVVRVDEVAKGAWEDIKEAASGKHGASRRWAGGVGAAGKISGWLAVVAGILYVALLFVPGVNVAMLASTALYLGATALVLGAVESDLRAQAAADEETAEGAREQISKGGAAGANVMAGLGLMVISFGVRILLKTPIPGRLETVGGALKAARTALLNKTGIGPALDSIRTALLTRLRDARKGMPELVAAEIKAVQEGVKQLEAMTGAQALERLAKGDKPLQELTGITADQARQIQGLAQTPAGAAVPEKLRAGWIEALKEAPSEATRRVAKIAASIDRTIAAVEQAKDPAALSKALDDAESQLGPAALAAEADVAAKGYAADAGLEARVKATEAAGTKSAKLQEVAELIKKPDPTHADRQQVIEALRTPHGAKGPGPLEGYIPRSALTENRVAVRKIREKLAASNPDVIVGMKRGGSFLTEVLAKGDPNVAAKVRTMDVHKGKPKAPGKKAPKFDRAAMAAEFTKLVDAGAKKIAVVDYYMGGTTASELSALLRDHFASSPKYAGVTVEVHWIRESFGLTDAGGTTLGPMRGTPGAGQKGAKQFSQTQEAVQLVLGDDMASVMTASESPIHIFDQTGKVIKTVTPKPKQTTRELLIELLNGSD